MIADLAQLRNQLRSLRAKRRDVVEELEQSLRGLTDDGRCPDHQLADHVALLLNEERSFRSRIQEMLPTVSDDHFDTIEAAILQRARALALRPAIIQLLNLQYTGEGELIELSQEQAKAQALLRKLRVGAACSENSDGPFTERHDLELALDPEVEQRMLDELDEGTHPWCALLKLQSKGEVLSDAEWDATEQIVEKELGRPLAVAAARGRLVCVDRPTDSLPLASINPLDITTDASTIAVQEVSGATSHEKDGAEQEVDSDNDLGTIEVAAVDSAKTSLEEATDEAAMNLTAVVGEETPEVSDDDSGLIFEEIDIEASERSQLARLGVRLPGTRGESNSNSKNLSEVDSIFEEALAEELSEENEESADLDVADPLKDIEVKSGNTAAEYETLDQNLVELAEAALAAPRNSRGTLIADLVWRLLYEGRVGLAWHLSHAAESHLTMYRGAPAWLVSAWGAGLSIMYPKGQLSLRLKQDLTHFTVGSFEATDDDSVALGLLLRASTLRSSIIAPWTRAGAVLKSLRLNSELLPRLYNYCSWIASSGEKLNGLFPASLKDDVDRQTIEIHLEELQHEVEQWREELSRWSIHFEPTQPLYQHGHWSLRQSLSQRSPVNTTRWSKWIRAMELVETVLAPITEETDVSSNVRALADRMLTKVVVARTDSSVDDDSIVVPTDEIRQLLEDAASFSHRWGTLQTQLRRGGRFVSSATESLIGEVCERHDDVLEELQQLVEERGSDSVRIGAACLMLAMQQLRGLFDRETPVTLHEVNTRHLLHADLLRIPEINLNPSWMPIGSPEQTIETLLRALTRPLLTWEAAFETHSKAENHEATERLLMLKLWDEEQQQSLAAQRSRRVASWRRRLEEELDEAQLALQAAAEQGVVNNDVKDRLSSEIQRLSIRLETASASVSLSEEVTATSQSVDRALPMGWRRDLINHRELEAKKLAESETELDEDSSLFFDEN